MIQPNGKAMRRWDAVTATSLIFTAFVTPVEASLLQVAVGSPLFVLNRVVDAIFVCDMVVQFFLPYRSRDGLLIYSNRQIACNYLRSSFLVDLVATIPYDSLMTAVQGGAETGGTGGSTLRTLKMLRLVKLVRIVKASRIIKRWKTSMGLAHAQLEVLKFFIISLVMAHWMACLWAFVGRSGDFDFVLEDDPRWAALFPGVPYAYQPGDVACLPDCAFRTHTWIQKQGMYRATGVELYGVSLYVALGNMFGGCAAVREDARVCTARAHARVPVRPCRRYAIEPASYVEFYVQSLMTLIGSCVWAYIIGAGCAIVATLDPQGIEFRQTMDELNYFSRDKKLPQDLTIRLRTFFQNTQHVIFARQYDGLPQKTSPLLLLLPPSYLPTSLPCTGTTGYCRR